MKKIVYLSVSLTVVIMIYGSLDNSVYPYSAGAPLQSGSKGFTGSPRDNLKTCSTIGCHIGASIIEKQGWITSNVPKSGYVEDSIYSITVQVSDQNAVKMGFMASIQNNSGSYIGTLFSPQNNEIQSIGNNNYVTHTNLGTEITKWSFNWIAPSPSDIGTVTVYAAINSANGDNAPSGDQIYVSSMEIIPFNDSEDFKIYPNPFNEKINILPNLKINSSIIMRVFNITGDIVYASESIEFNQQNEINLSQLSKGIYFIKLEYNDKTLQRKILKY